MSIENQQGPQNQRANAPDCFNLVFSYFKQNCSIEIPSLNLHDLLIKFRLGPSAVANNRENLITMSIESEKLLQRAYEKDFKGTFRKTAFLETLKDFCACNHETEVDTSFLLPGSNLNSFIINFYGKRPEALIAYFGRTQRQGGKYLKKEYDEALKGKPLFPFHPKKLREHLSLKHKIGKVDLVHNQTEKTAFLFTYTEEIQIPLSTICRISNEGKFAEVTSMQLQRVSYKALDEFFFSDFQINNDYPKFRQFLSHFRDILQGKFDHEKLKEEKLKDEKLKEKNYGILWIEMVELMIYQEGSRYLGCLLHTLMWVRYNLYTLSQLKTPLINTSKQAEQSKDEQKKARFQDVNKLKKFAALPYAIEGAVPVMRQLRKETKFTFFNFEYFYDYCLEGDSKEMAEYKMREKYLIVDFMKIFGIPNASPDLFDLIMKLHLNEFFPHFLKERIVGKEEKVKENLTAAQEELKTVKSNEITALIKETGALIRKATYQTRRAKQIIQKNKPLGKLNRLENYFVKLITKLKSDDQIL